MFASLRARTLLVLVAAVLPAALVIGALAWHAFQQARQDGIDGLQRDSSLLAARLDAGVLDASRLADVLASFGPSGLPIEACAKALGTLRPRLPGYAGLIAWQDDAPSGTPSMSGMPACASMAASLPPGLVTTADLAALHPGEQRVRLAPLPGGRAALWAGARGTGEAQGRVVAAVLDPVGTERLLGLFRGEPSSVAMLSDREGHVVRGPGADPAAWPVGALPLDTHPVLVEAASRGGRPMVYTSDRLADAELWLLTAQRRSDLLDAPVRQLVTLALVPLALLLVAALAIWFGLTTSVLRWVKTLRRVARAYAGGDLASRVGDASAAPRELGELATAFDTLADHVAARAQDLEREVAAKATYIRELHHRVKNNLQVIGSLISLQKREVAPEQRGLLRFPEDRLNAMSAAYRASYAVSESGFAPIGGLVRELSQRLQTSGSGKPVVIEVQIEGGELEIDLDAAISIAMLTAEVLPTYVDKAAETGTAVVLRIEATRERLVIVLRGSPEVQRASNHLSRRFIQAYLRQLDGKLDEAEPGQTRFEAPFPRDTRSAPLTAASSR